MLLSLQHLVDPSLAQYIEESQQMNAARAAAAPHMQPDLADPTVLKAVRAAREQSRQIPEREALQQTIQAGTQKIPVRIIYPKQTKPKGVFLEIHGGGFYMESAARDDAENIRLADAAGIVVVSIDYRLAPENPWPAAPDDCEAAASWLLDHAQAEFGTKKLLLGGASAGAHLAVTTMLRLRDHGLLHPFIGAVLAYGAYDLSGLTPGGRLYKDEYFIKAYAGQAEDRTIPDISPVFGNLKGFPPVLMLVGTSDLLLEDNLAMCARLIGEGNIVDLHLYPESVHGFLSRQTKMSVAAHQNMYAWVARQLQRGEFPAHQ